MKEVLGSLPEVITAYKNYNLLVPTATDVQLNPFYKFHVEEVPVDLGENSGDIFKVGSVKTGKQDEKGKDIWEDVFSLSKPLLNKMAMAAGIQFNPKETYGERIDRVTYRAQAQGAMRKADGTARTETDQKVICLEDEEEKYRIEFADKAAKGITDEKQAQAAAEIFSGQWVESKNKWGKKCQAFVVAKEDRDRYIDRSVMVNMALLKKTWAEKAMTGAKLRVIRALLGVKGTYTKAELQKNFAIPTVIFSPDFSDPQVRQAMLTQLVKISTRRGKAREKRLISHVIFYADDIVLFSGNKKDVHMAQRMLIEYMNKILDLDIKPDWKMTKAMYEDRNGKARGSLLDYMGFRFHGGNTVSKGYLGKQVKHRKTWVTIRKRIFLAARRKRKIFSDKLRKKIQVKMKFVQSVVSQFGWFKSTNMAHYRKKNRVDQLIKIARKIVSDYAKGKEYSTEKYYKMWRKNYA